MKIECGRDVSEAETMGAGDTIDLSLKIIAHFVWQGAMRGFLYGAGVGVLLWIIGALPGCIIGGVAGALIGLLDGAVLAVIATFYRRNMSYDGEFLWVASWLTPLLTFFAVMLICGAFVSMGDPGGFAASIQNEGVQIALGICAAPALVAAFASWQSVQKMSDWYL